jgi:cytochrome c-type biogenesis protein CcmH/NrfG
MWGRLFRLRRARRFLIVGLAAATAGIALADRFLGDRVPWRALYRHRQDVQALARGHADLDQGRFRRAIQAVSGIREGSASEAEALTIRGLAEANLEDVGPARRDLERAWRIQPNAAAAKVLAAIYLSAYETERGFQMLMNASRLDPEDFRPWYAMGELVHLRLRRYGPAMDAFREALKRRPGHVESRIGLIEALVRSHRPADAEPILTGVREERPDDPRVAALAAEIALELGRDEDAARFLERSLAIDPDRREALILEARLRLRQGRPREALAAAERACALEPNDPAALGLLASIQATLGLKEQAIRTQHRRHQAEHWNQEIERLLQTILKSPEDPEPRWRLGRIAAEAGRKTLAIQSYQAALALAPDCQPARQGLIELGFSVPRAPRGAPGPLSRVSR